MTSSVTLACQLFTGQLTLATFLLVFFFLARLFLLFFFLVIVPDDLFSCFFSLLLSLGPLLPCDHA